MGARALAGADSVSDACKQAPGRRPARLIEDSLPRGLAWSTFESEGEALWARVRLVADAVMQTLFRQGAFQGSAWREAYFAKCDAATTSAVDLAGDVCGLLLGVAALKLAELVVLHLRRSRVMPTA